MPSTSSLEPTEARTTAVQETTGPLPSAHEHKKPWKRRPGRPSKRRSLAHDSGNSTSLFTQEMDYQAGNNDAKFYVFSYERGYQQVKPNNKISSLTGNIDDTDGTSSHEDGPANVPLPNVTSVRFVNRTIDGPFRSAVFTLPDLSKCHRSIGSIDSTESASNIDAIDDIDDKNNDKGFNIPTPMSHESTHGQVHEESTSQNGFPYYMWEEGSFNNAMTLPSNFNFSYGPSCEVGNYAGNVPLGVGVSSGLGQGNESGHSTSHWHNNTDNAATAYNDNCFVVPNISFAQQAFLSPTPADAVLGKRRHDDSDNYELARYQRPVIFDELYRSQRLEEAMAAACGETAAGQHAVVATTIPVSPDPVPGSVTAIATYFNSQPVSTNTLLDLEHSYVSNQLLGMGGIEGMEGLSSLGLNLASVGLGPGGMGAPQGGNSYFPTTTAPQGGNSYFPTTTAPEEPPVYMGWPTSNPN